MSEADEAMKNERYAIVLTKPRIAKCGNHWTVEYNRRGDWFPMHFCFLTWENALKKAENIVSNKLHA